MTRSTTDKYQRIFIGVPLDGKAQVAIDSLLGPLHASGRNLRFAPADNRHLTLAFLGDIPGTDAEFLTSVFATAYDRVERFRYRFSALQRFPNPRGKILALTGAPSEPLQHLVELTTGMLKSHALPFDQKKFRPHVTLARLRNPRQEKLSIDEIVDVGLDVTRVALYRSILTKSGSIYEILRSASLQ